MQAFTFQNPTRIVFGADAVSRAGEEAKPLGGRALLVYGRSSFRESGLRDRLLGQLRAQGIVAVEHGGVRPNPVLSHAREGISLARREEVDFILAAGGGSVIDEAKAIAAGVRAEGDVWDFFSGRAGVREALPLFCVLTVPATGSEMNGWMVLTHDETRQKFGAFSACLYPKVSILDPAVTCTVSPTYSAYAAVDATSHLLEGYFTGRDPHVAVQDRLVEGLVRTIMESAEAILRKPLDYEARAAFMWCATLAWNGLCTAGIGPFSTPGHMLEHPLSGLHDIAHGAGLSITLPAWMKFAAQRGNPKIVKLAENLFGIRSGSEAEKARGGIEALESWFASIGSPTRFRQASIREADLERITEKAAELARLKKLEGYDREVIAGIYRLAL